MEHHPFNNGSPKKLFFFCRNKPGPEFSREHPGREPMALKSACLRRCLPQKNPPYFFQFTNHSNGTRLPSHQKNPMIFPIIDDVFPWKSALGTTHPPLLRQPRRGQRLRQLRRCRAQALKLGATQGHQGTLERHLAIEVFPSGGDSPMVN